MDEIIFQLFVCRNNNSSLDCDVQSVNLRNYPGQFNSSSNYCDIFHDTDVYVYDVCRGNCCRACTSSQKRQESYHADVGKITDDDNRRYFEKTRTVVIPRNNYKLIQILICHSKAISERSCTHNYNQIDCFSLPSSSGCLSMFVQKSDLNIRHTVW